MHAFDLGHVKEIRAKLSRLKLPSPKLVQLPALVEQLRAKWGAASELRDMVTEELWNKIARFRQNADLEEEEVDLIPLVLFTRVKEKKEPFYKDPEICAFLMSKMAESASPEGLHSLVTLFFSRYPKKNPEVFEAICTKLRQIAAVRHDVDGLKRLADDGLLDADGARKCAELIDVDSGIEDGLRDCLGDYFSKGSDFLDCVWTYRCQVYSDLMNDAYYDCNDVSSALQRIYSDCQTVKKTTIYSNQDVFLESVLAPFLEFHDVPDAPVRDAIFECLDRILGTNSGENWWETTHDPVKSLLELWQVAQRFDSAFAFVECVLLNHTLSTTADVGQWRERRVFWDRYLRKGFIKGCRLYAPNPSQFSELKRTYGKNPAFAKAVSTMGVLRYNSTFRLMLFMTLTEGSFVVEFSNNGAMRIGRTSSDLNDERYSLSFYDLDYLTDERINHSSGWQRNAERVLKEILL